MKTCLTSLALISALSLASPLALAAPEAGDRSLTLSGTGNSDDSFDTNAFGVSGSIGWFTSDVLEIGIRQSANGLIVDDGEDSWSGSTRAFVDYHFNTGTMVIPFIGANLGGIYGDGVEESGTAGVEAGAKFYVKEKTFIMGMVEWQYLFEDADEIDNNFDDGAFFYTLGIGYNF